MKVEIWFDYVCPFSYLGRHNFEVALKKFAYHNKIKVEYKSFELASDIEISSIESYYQLLANRLGMNVTETKETIAKITEQATAYGLTYRFDTVQPTNTFKAHQLTQYAMKHGKAGQLAKRILQAYFTDSEHIGDVATLLRIAAGVGLDEKEVAAIIQSNDYAKQVRADEREAQSIGVTGTPFFVFHEKYAIPGVQSVEGFTEVLEEVWEEASKELLLKKENQRKTTYCIGDNCVNEIDS